MAAFSITAEELMAQTIAALKAEATELGQTLSDEDGPAFVAAMTGLPMGQANLELPKSQAETDEMLGQLKDMPLEVFEQFKMMASKGAGKGKQGGSMAAFSITLEEMTAQIVVTLKARATELGHPFSDEDAALVAKAMSQDTVDLRQATVDATLGMIKAFPKKMFEEMIVEMMETLVQSSTSLDPSPVLAMAMSSVSCQCGNVKLNFPESRPRFRYQCMCIDCRQKSMWAWTQGGPAVPADVVEYKRGLDTKYLGNVITVEQGKEQLEFFKLRPEGDGQVCTNCISKCCKTILMADLPIYEGKSVFIAEAAVVETDLSSFPPMFYGWMGDFPQEKLAELKELHPTDKIPIPEEQEIKFAHPECLGAWFGAVVSDAPPASRGSTTFQQLQAEAGEIKILGLAKGAVIEPPASASNFFLVEHSFKAGKVEEWWSKVQAVMSDASAWEAFTSEHHKHGFHNHAFLPGCDLNGPMFCVWEAEVGKTAEAMQAFIDGPSGPSWGLLGNVVLPLDPSAGHLGYTHFFDPTVKPPSSTPPSQGSTFYIVKHFIKAGQADAFFANMSEMPDPEASIVKHFEMMDDPEAMKALQSKLHTRGFHGHSFFRLNGKTEGLFALCLWEAKEGKTPQDVQCMMDHHVMTGDYCTNVVYPIEVSKGNIGVEEVFQHRGSEQEQRERAPRERERR